MGRKTTCKVGDRHGGLEVLEIIPSRKAGTHVKLKCRCHYCGGITTMISANLKKNRKSCGCQQRNSKLWKRVGAKTRPWQLASGKAARNNVEFSYRRCAARRNVPYELTPKQFDQLIAGPCYYCGNARGNTKKGQGKTSGDFKYTGIDRIDSTKGYTKKNVVSCCWVCNNMKNKLPQDVFLAHIKKIYQHRRFE